MLNINSTRSAVGVLALICAVAVPMAAHAGKKPRPSKPANAAAIEKAHSGKSWKWSKGGAYFAANGQFEAIWEGAVGIGTWSVNRSGTLCYRATWYWIDNGVKKDKMRKCWRHVVDSQGNTWQRNDEKNDWYVFTANGISKGNRFRSQVASRKSKMGL